jgi:hypothetical protein
MVVRCRSVLLKRFDPGNRHTDTSLRLSSRRFDVKPCTTAGAALAHCDCCAERVDWTPRWSRWGRLAAPAACASGPLVLRTLPADSRSETVRRS